jgi:hypothetical protein
MKGFSYRNLYTMRDLYASYYIAKEENEHCYICLDPLRGTRSIAHEVRGKWTKPHPLHLTCAKTCGIRDKICPICKISVDVDALPYTLKERFQVFSYEPCELIKKHLLMSTIRGTILGGAIGAAITSIPEAHLSLIAIPALAAAGGAIGASTRAVGVFIISAIGKVSERLGDVRSIALAGAVGAAGGAIMIAGGGKIVDAAIITVVKAAVNVIREEGFQIA